MKTVVNRFPLSVLCGAFAFLLFAGAARLAAANEQAVLDEWNAKLARAAQLVRAGSFDDARKLTLRLTDELVRRLGTGRGAELFLARAAAFRALAESGLGDTETAIWYWDVARAISNQMDASDLAAFGEVAEPLIHLDDVPHGCCDLDGEQSESFLIEPPRAIERPRPKFPRGAAKFGVEGQLVVQIIIDQRGQPTRAKVVKALPAPSLTYSALEAVRKWRFEPATLAGQPVEVYYNLTVNYKLKR